MINKGEITMCYSVYKHTLPDNKVYIGITSVPLTERWDNGFGYERQPKFFREIVKYGWDNIKHDILAVGLSEKDARSMEKYLIEQEVNNVLNTQCRAGVDLSWTKSVINQDIPNVRHQKFIQYNDRWLDKVRYNNTVPYRWEIGDEYMKFDYATMNGNIATYSTIIVPIPLNITYNELYNYILWKLNFDKEKRVVSQVNAGVSI